MIPFFQPQEDRSILKSFRTKFCLCYKAINDQMWEVGEHRMGTVGERLHSDYLLFMIWNVLKKFQVSLLIGFMGCLSFIRK